MEGRMEGPLLQFLDPDITEVEVVGLPVILKGNVSFHRTVADAGVFSFAFLIELVVDDLLAIKLDLKVVVGLREGWCWVWIGVGIGAGVKVRVAPHLGSL